MRKLLLLIFAFFFAFAGFTQSSYSEVKLEVKEDYQLAESVVLKASNYLLTTKYDKEDLERLYAIEFIMKWMGGTPDFSFELDEKFTKPFIQETDLLGLYMGALAKYAIEHKNEGANPNIINLNAVKMVINYSNKAANNLKQTGELKKIAAALKKGELEKYFGI
jgi:hypothetical protein